MIRILWKKYLVGVSTACSSEHSHETLWGVTVYSTGSPNSWRQDRYFGFKMPISVLLWVESFQYRLIWIFF